MSRVRSFFDTNVLVYADDASVPAKQRHALELVAVHRRAGTGVVSAGAPGIFCNCDARTWVGQRRRPTKSRIAGGIRCRSTRCIRDSGRE